MSVKTTTVTLNVGSFNDRRQKYFLEYDRDMVLLRFVKVGLAKYGDASCGCVASTVFELFAV
jgi:hypothetical protein